MLSAAKNMIKLPVRYNSTKKENLMRIRTKTHSFCKTSRVSLTATLLEVAQMKMNKRRIQVAKVAG